MITLSDWVIDDADKLEKFIGENYYSAAFTSQDIRSDSRCKRCAALISTISESSIPVSFNLDGSFLQIGSIQHKTSELNHVEMNPGKLLLDCTSLDFPEILYLFKLAKLKEIPFDAMYIEPDEYKSTEESQEDTSITRFELSEDGPGIEMLQGFVFPLQGRKIAVSLGFEGHRFSSLLRSDEFSSARFQALVGIPAFKPGWEIRCIDENRYSLAQILSSQPEDLLIAGANDPYSNYQNFKNMYEVESYSNKGEQPIIHLAPYGTKPVAISAAWFAVNNPGVGILYDFVRRKKEISKGVGKVHLYKFSTK